MGGLVRPERQEFGRNEEGRRAEEEQRQGGQRINRVG